MAEKAEMQKLKSWMRRRFMPDRCTGWESTIFLRLRGAGDMTAEFEGGEMHLLSGLKGEPLAVIRTDIKTLGDVLRNALPLEIAVMKNDLETDNMIETFKFVTVFRPDRRSVSGGGGEKKKVAGPERAPLLEGGAEAKLLIRRINEKIMKNDFINQYLEKNAVKIDSVVRLNNPEVRLRLEAGKKGMKVETLPPGKKADVVMESATLHGILCGAQNITIGLTNKNLDKAAGGIGPRALEMLIYIQPTLAALYREVHADGEGKI